MRFEVRKFSDGFLVGTSRLVLGKDRFLIVLLVFKMGKIFH